MFLNYISISKYYIYLYVIMKCHITHQSLSNYILYVNFHQKFISLNIQSRMFFIRSPPLKVYSLNSALTDSDA